MKPHPNICVIYLVFHSKTFQTFRRLAQRLNSVLNVFLKVWQNSQLWAQTPLFRDDETHCRLARRYLYLRICFAPRSQVCLFDPQSLLRWPLPVALHLKAGPKVGDGSCNFFTAGDSGVIYDTVHSHVNWNSQRIVKGDLMDMLWHAMWIHVFRKLGAVTSFSFYMGTFDVMAFAWICLRVIPFDHVSLIFN